MRTRRDGRLMAWATVAAISTTAWAGELSIDEKRWLRQCVDGLRSNSDKVREGAEQAIAALGEDAIEPVIPLLFALDVKDDEDWRAAARALRALGEEATASAVEGAREQWPKTHQARLATLVTDLRTHSVKPRRAPPTAAPPAGSGPAPESKSVSDEVNAILATFESEQSMSSSDPRLRRIAALGRAAVPPLLSYLRDDGHGMAATAAGHALDRTVTEEDIPAVADALLAGVERAGSSLSKFATPAARDALVAAVRAGVLGHAVMEGLRPHRRDREVHAALIEWVGKQGSVPGYEVGITAEFLADAGVTDAASPLMPFLQRRGGGRWQVAKALARLGVRDGIPVLIEILAEPAERFEGYARHSAGEALNRILGRHFYNGRFEDPMSGPTGNMDEAAKQYREWWDANSEKAKFDPATKRWNVP